MKRGAPGECWPWTGVTNRQGYGLFGVGRSGKRRTAHRWLWEQINGPASSKLDLDHLCRNTLCVNPAHMELVTHIENVRRGMEARNPTYLRTHCPQGHPFDETNTYRRPDTGRRQCRACKREKIRSRRARLKQAAS